MLLVTLYWVSCDGLASHPGRGELSNAHSYFMLGILCWTTIPYCRGGGGGEVVMLDALYWILRIL